uniref:Uncharacterized protein n=1 Tax=Picea glauca TaxID=3330 RepID=A0A117NIE0_PICGL|nr:hypothetical protein ABT39_MTgene3002 [Picea glauca]
MEIKLWLQSSDTLFSFVAHFRLFAIYLKIQIGFSWTGLSYYNFLRLGLKTGKHLLGFLNFSVVK